MNDQMIQTITAWKILRENREAFGAWMRDSGFGKGMDRLDSAYLGTCSEIVTEMGYAEGTLFAVRDPQRLQRICEILENDDGFMQTNRQKNSRILPAMKRYLEFCREETGWEDLPDAETLWAALPGSQPVTEEEIMPEESAEEDFEIPLPEEIAEEETPGEEMTGPEAAEEEDVPAVLQEGSFAEDTESFSEDTFTEAPAEEPEEEAGSADEPAEEPEEEIEPTSMEIVFGTSQEDGRPVIWHPNDTSLLFHTNTGIIGTMGTGKTQFAKSLIAQLYREQPNNFAGSPLGILIFDYKGDYNETKWDFREATQAKVLKPYHLPFNPLAITKTSVFRPLLPSHTGNAFKDTIARTYHMGAKQQSALFRSIMSAYKAAGILSDQPHTWERTAPTFADVYQVYIGQEDGGKGDSLSAAMEKLAMFEIFEPDARKTKSLFDLLNGVVVIDLSGYDPDIQSLVVEMTLNLFYAQMQAAGSSRISGPYRELTKMILVDEADHFMSEGYPSLKKILKEGREFGVGVILSTQFLRHFSAEDDNYAKYILTWVVHNVADLKQSDVDFVFRTKPNSEGGRQLFHEIRLLKEHTSIVKIGTEPPVTIDNLPFWKLIEEE